MDNLKKLNQKQLKKLLATFAYSLMDWNHPEDVAQAVEQLDITQIAYTIRCMDSPLKIKESP